MSKNSVLNLPLHEVMRPEIALTLQHVLQLYTVGSFLSAWRNPKNHKSIEQVFDSPQQARHAAAVCATWLGIQSAASKAAYGAWWVGGRSQPGGSSSRQPVAGKHAGLRSWRPDFATALSRPRRRPEVKHHKHRAQDEPEGDVVVPRQLLAEVQPREDDEDDQRNHFLHHL